jgi:hypothetical protein
VFEANHNLEDELQTPDRVRAHVVETLWSEPATRGPLITFGPNLLAARFEFCPAAGAS